MINDFGYGTVFPYEIMLKPGPRFNITDPSLPPVLQSNFFSIVNAAIQRWHQTVSHGEKVSYTGIMYENGHPSDRTLLLDCLKPGTIHEPALCGALRS